MADLNLSMFRSNDIRTPAARLTDELALRLARAEALYFRKVLGVTGVVVAHDARATGPRMLELAAQEYRRAGLDVVVLPGITGVCQLYYAAMRHPDLAAVMFGASHNPAGDTGRKILGAGVRPIAEGLGPEGGLTCIRSFYERGEEATADQPGRMYAFDAVPGYVAYSLTEAGVDPGSLRRLSILHDYLYGAGGRELMLGFQPTGVRLEPLHFAADGQFRLGDPNPVKEDVIAPGLARLGQGSFDLGMFYDGDADRLDVYLADGTYVASSLVYAAILPWVLRRHAIDKPTVLVDSKCSPLAAAEMARAGARVEIVGSGHSRIKTRMYERPDIVGTVEESAHFYDAFRLEGTRYCTENTLFFSLLVARVFRDAPDRFRHMIGIQARTARARDWGYKFPSEEQRAGALQAVVEHFEAKGASVLERLADGTDLQGHMMRTGLPFDITADVEIPDRWLQISQRPSTSEDGLARWEVVGSDPELVTEAKCDIQNIVARFGAGPEYRG